jgi:hypothetical protein
MNPLSLLESHDTAFSKIEEQLRVKKMQIQKEMLDS